MRNVIAIATFLVASSLAAQPLTVGTQLPDYAGTVTITSGAPVTFVNLTGYAPAAGTVNKASVGWNANCASAFRIVFLRNNFNSASSFTVVASRGPFNAVSGRNDVTLTPPVTVANGDLIGVVQLQPYAACGSVIIQEHSGKLGYNLITTTDLSVSGGTLGSSSNYNAGFDFAAVAYTTDPVLVRILPAAGAVQGSTAFFRTAVQMLNSTSSPIVGNFVFHKQGQSAGAGDPTLPFTLASGQTQSFADVITSMGTSGLGSLDITTNGGAQPIVTARVFSDGGTAGTSGFSEEGVSPGDALDFTSRGILIIPSDLSNFRVNIGVRTLDAGATLSMSMVDSAGTLRATRNGVVYPANYFIQTPLSDFIGTTDIPAGGCIRISVSFPGRAFVYSSIIDNRTSDSTFRLADIK